MKKATNKRLAVGRETIKTLLLVPSMDKLALVHGGTSTTTTQQGGTSTTTTQQGGGIHRDADLA